jgi:hypothetical protein
MLVKGVVNQEHLTPDQSYLPVFTIQCHDLEQSLIIAVQFPPIRIFRIYQRRSDGLMFTVSLLAILLAHEFGHYLAGRYHRSAVTLPYFIPFPSAHRYSGAFIRFERASQEQTHPA